ncbi:YsnF/AvaK domain-containing protein [Paracoccus haeundaensis]|nr:YsnF/AvaK domain-containing protein [Paracoccus haeundaensis]
MMTYDSTTDTAGEMSVSALFDTQDDAQRAVDRLLVARVDMSQIRLDSGKTDTATEQADQGKGFWDSLGDLLMPDEDRYSYAEGLSRGGHLLTVSGLDSEKYDAVLDILDDEGTVNLDEREASWRNEGWGGYEVSPYAAERATAAGHSATPSGESIPVVQETLRVGKRDTSHGRVRIRAYTVETPVSETVELRDEHVELVRTPVDRPAIVDEDYRERTFEAEEHREEAVVSKEARVVEEIGLRKTSDTRQETVSDTVRHTEVEVDDERSTLGRDDRNRTRE